MFLYTQSHYYKKIIKCSSTSSKMKLCEIVEKNLPEKCDNDSLLLMMNFILKSQKGTKV